MHHERRMDVGEGTGLDEHGLPRRITARRRIRQADQFLGRRAEHRHP
jgi:hypothetical protein